MDDIYNDLENYDEVDLIKELRSENSELKHKLAECTTTMEMLQKDFDKLSAEFKTLEMNYSSLLKIARTEIKRKTDMITNLNIEKDKLVIKATQSVPPNKVQQLIRNLGTEDKRKKKKRNKGGGQKKDEIRQDCERPPSSETSSTATDNTNKMLSKERVDSLKSTCRIATKENEIHKPEWFPDHRGDGNRSPVGNIVDRRVSALARPPFSKLSSDEEFEDMYSALEPKTPSLREPERSRKRGRDRSLDARTYNASGPQDKPSNYPEPFRERHVKSRSSRFSASDRNMNRDKEYNESDRNMFRDKQYNENDRNMNRDKQYNENERNMNRDKYDPHYRRYSPERHRRVGREFGDERYSQQYDRHRRLESPPRERYPAHRSRERWPPHDRERDEPKQGVRYNQPDTHSVRPRIHGEYDEPQNKRPRVEQHLNRQDDRRQSEQQYYKDIHPAEVRERTCQSPDFSHTENESSNEPMPVIKSTDPTLEDPRIISKKYVKTTEGDKEVLHTANVNETDLQPVNKSLWNLQVVHVPQALRQKPLEISEELVDQIDLDKPGSILSMESGEVGSETTDTFLDDFSDHREVDEGVNSNYKCVSSKNDHIKIEKRKDKEKSPVEKTYKDVAHKRDLVQKESIPTRHKLEEANNGCKADETPIMSFEDSNKDQNNMHSNVTEKPSILHNLIQLADYNSELVDNHRVDKPTTKMSKDSDNASSNTHCDNTEKPSILHRVISSVSETHKSPESDKTVKSKIMEEKEHNSDLTTSTTSEKETESSVAIFRDFEHRVYSTRHIVEGDLHLSDDTNDEAPAIKDEKVQMKKKQKTKKKSHRDPSKEKYVESEDTTRRTRSKKDKAKEEKPQNKFCELFGDSSSLITPEELNIATREAHALPADCCPPLCEDAQDGLIQIQKPVQIHASESKVNTSGSVIMEDKLKTTRDSKNRTHHKKHKDKESILVSKDIQKDPKEMLNEKVDSTDSQLVSGIKLVFSSEKLKEMQNAKITIDKKKNDLLKSHEKPKEPVKSNKKSKSKHEKKLSVSEASEDSNIKKTNSLGTSSNKALVVGDNKENADCNDNSEKNVSNEMAKNFEDTTDSSKNTFVESSKVNEEKLQLGEKLTETISNTTDVPNLAPVTDEPGLVKTVVISTGNQHLDSNTVQYIEPLNGLATSTPAKEISAINTSEIDPKKQTACVNVTIASEDSVSHSQSETDAPDVRINYYKRRRKVLKK